MELFSNKYLSDYKILNSSVVGFEFEGYTDKSLYKLVEMLNIHLAPVKVHYFAQYHSGFKVDTDNWKLEKDESGGGDMWEIVTGPMPYADARSALISIINFINQFCETDDKCSIHVNISFPNKPMTELNKLKLILDINEDYIYKLFPERKGNIYAKSIKRVIPFEDWDSSAAAINMVSQYMSLPEDTKYYGVNLSTTDRGWIEYRYIGDIYQKKLSAVLELVDYFIVQTYNALDSTLDEEHYIKLKSYLDKNIEDLNTFKKYNGFLAAQPKIDLQVDKTSDYDYVNAYYGTFYKELYQLFNNTQEFIGGVINYDTERSRIEVLQAQISTLQYANDIDFIQCTIDNAHIENCEIIDCDIDKSHMVETTVRDSRLKDSKLTSCTVGQDSELTNCYFFGGSLGAAEMKGGVFRSGKLSPDSILSPQTLKPTTNNFWGIPGSIKTPKKPTKKK